MDYIHHHSDVVLAFAEIVAVFVARCRISPKSRCFGLPLNILAWPDCLIVCFFGVRAVCLARYGTINKPPSRA